MQVQNGDTYTSSFYSKSLMVSEAKVGKTVFLVASALGLLPGQKAAIVSRPEDLIILAFDESTLSGLKRFLLERLKAPEEALKFVVYNYQDDVNRLAREGGDYDATLYQSLIETRDKIAGSMKGVGVVLASSLSGMAQGVERAIMGRPGGEDESMKKGYGSIPKWHLFGAVMMELRRLYHIDKFHCWWEGHILKKAGKEGEPDRDSIAISGATGDQWAAQCAQVFRIRRSFGKKFSGTEVDEVYADTQPSLSFTNNGRGFATSLKPKEYDLTDAFERLGLKVGGWEPKRTTK